jgi:hypothetical protein
MSRRVDTDVLNQLSSYINAGYTVTAMSKKLGMTTLTLRQRIRRNSQYIISKLPPTKHTTLRLLISKGRNPNNISLALDIPETLVNRAIEHYKDEDYPSLRGSVR